jgi:hypothetical protein
VLHRWILLSQTIPAIKARLNLYRSRCEYRGRPHLQITT